jgi:hypothetical protein
MASAGGACRNTRRTASRVRASTPSRRPARTTDSSNRRRCCARPRRVSEHPPLSGYGAGYLGDSIVCTGLDYTRRLPGGAASRNNSRASRPTGSRRSSTRPDHDRHDIKPATRSDTKRHAEPITKRHAEPITKRHAEPITKRHAEPTPDAGAISDDSEHGRRAHP